MILGCLKFDKGDQVHIYLNLILFLPLFLLILNLANLKNSYDLESKIHKYFSNYSILKSHQYSYLLSPVNYYFERDYELIEAFLTKLQSQNVQGVHLTVSKNNQNAIGFYSHVGFQKLKELEEAIIFVKSL